MSPDADPLPAAGPSYRWDRDQNALPTERVYLDGRRVICLACKPGHQGWILSDMTDPFATDPGWPRIIKPRFVWGSVTCIVEPIQRWTRFDGRYHISHEYIVQNLFTHELGHAIGRLQHER